MLFSQEIKFKAEKMEVGENGKLIIGYNSNTDIPEDNINIFSKKVEYNKNKSLVIFTDKVFFYDKKNNIVIEGDKIIYDKN